MNFLFHCWEYPPRGSGIGRYISHMATALRAAGHFTVIVTSHASDEEPSEQELDGGYIFRLYKKAQIGEPWLTDTILKLSGKYRIDWLEGADHLGETAPLILTKNRPPVVIKTHYNDVLKKARYAQARYFWQKPLIDMACFRDRRRLMREKISLAQADCLIAPASRIIEEMSAQKVALAEKRLIIPNPIPPKSYEHGLEAETPTVLLVGRVDIGKGIEFLPRIVRTLKARVGRFALEVAGGDSYARLLGSTRNWLKRQLGPDGEEVTFLGNLDRNALSQAYARAWVVIVPSKWDTFPTVVLEAMARGKAIVASPHGGMSEMLLGTRCAIAEPAEPEFGHRVAEFLLDHELRRHAGETAAAKARSHFAPEHLVTSYLTLMD